MHNIRESNGLLANSEKQNGQFYCRFCVFLICFSIFLPIVLVSRLLKLQWRPWVAGPERYKSIFNEAKTVANSFIPFVYMA